jgi:hypothetical protein
MTRRALIVAVTVLSGGVVLAVIRSRGELLVTCPDGTVLAEARPPVGREQWCERLPLGIDRRHGPYRAWYPDGRVKIEGQFVNGRKAGRWVFWHGNGILNGKGVKREEGEFREGREHGRWTRWRDSDITLEEGEYRDGVRHGLWRRYSVLGIKEAEGQYSEGAESGVWYRWNEKGESCPPEDHGAPIRRLDDGVGAP